MMLYFYFFIIYSIIGWIIEMTFTSITTKKVVNRGFLLGPYCPIYGTGALFIVLFLGKYKNDIIVLFTMAVVICSIIEYVTSYLMEKIFKARWWDYSDFSFNLNGRICLSNAMAFGVLGVAVVNYVHPLVLNLLTNVNINFFYIFGYTITIIFTIDAVLSFSIITKLKFTVDAIKKDYTDEITEKIRNVLIQKSRLIKRLIDAFPDFNIISRKK